MRSAGRLAAAAVILAALASPAHAKIYVDLILDSSGSMWGQVRGRSRLLIMREAVRSIHRHATDGVEIGIRTFAIQKQGPRTVQLLPIGDHGESTVRAALLEIVPRGQSELVAALKGAARDFAGKDGKRVTFAIVDGSDTTVDDACAALTGLQEELGGAVHVIGLDVRDNNEREALKCIAKASGGIYKDARTTEGVIYVTRQVIGELIEQEAREETERLEAERQRRLLIEQTRLRISFFNELDSFFAEKVLVRTVLLDEQPLEVNSEIVGEGSVELFYRPIPEGKHTVSLRYVKIKGGVEGESEIKRLQFEVQRGKTTEVRAVARAGLARWKVDLTSEIKDSAPDAPDAPEEAKKPEES